MREDLMEFIENHLQQPYRLTKLQKEALKSLEKGEQSGIVWYGRNGRKFKALDSTNGRDKTCKVAGVKKRDGSIYITSVDYIEHLININGDKTKGDK